MSCAIVDPVNARTGRSTKNDIIGQYGEDTLKANVNRLIELCKYN